MKICGRGLRARWERVERCERLERCERAGEGGRWDNGCGEIGRGEIGRGEMGRGEMGRGEMGRGERGRGEATLGESGMEGAAFMAVLAKPTVGTGDTIGNAEEGPVSPISGAGVPTIGGGGTAGE